MALVRTTLSSACAGGSSAPDKNIVVASATGFSAGYRIEVDGEVMRVAKSYVSGTTIPVLRAQEGTFAEAHNATAGVVCGVASDFPSQAPQTVVQKPYAGRARTIHSISASATITPPVDGSDLLLILNGTNALTVTVAVPTKDMDGCELTIVSNGVAQHLLTFTGGLSGAGTSYDVITINATAPAAFRFIACNSLWMAICGPAISGTTTAIAGAIA